MTQIEQIKSEIKRLKENKWMERKDVALDWLLSFIESLEKERPEIKPNDYIIKTKEDEFVIVYAVNDYYSKPKEFCEHGFYGRRWKPSEVEVVEYPRYEHGNYTRYRTSKYLNADIKIGKE